MSISPYYFYSPKYTFEVQGNSLTIYQLHVGSALESVTKLWQGKIFVHCYQERKISTFFEKVSPLIPEEFRLSKPTLSELIQKVMDAFKKTLPIRLDKENAHLRCPISGAVFESPVLLSCGETVSKAHLLEWNNQCQGAWCPCCEKSAHKEPPLPNLYLEGVLKKTREMREFPKVSLKEESNLSELVKKAEDLIEKGDLHKASEIVNGFDQCSFDVSTYKKIPSIYMQLDRKEESCLALLNLAKHALDESSLDDAIKILEAIPESLEINQLLISLYLRSKDMQEKAIVLIEKLLRSKCKLDVEFYQGIMEEIPLFLELCLESLNEMNRDMALQLSLSIISSRIEAKDHESASKLIRSIGRLPTTMAIQFYKEMAQINPTYTLRHMDLEKKQSAPSLIFGPNEWQNSLKLKVKNPPPIPSSIYKILSSPCPYFFGSTVAESHVLLLIPANMSLLRFNLLYQTTGEAPGVDLIDFLTNHQKTKESVLIGRESVQKDLLTERSYWILVTNNRVSSGSKYALQTFMQAYADYDIPTELEAIIYFFAANVLYSTSPTSTMCNNGLEVTSNLEIRKVQENIMTGIIATRRI